LLYLFEDFALDTERRELRRGDTVLSVEPKVFDLLTYVIGNRERVVTRDDLLSSVWARRIVSESALTTCINAARSAIADSGDEQRLIKTLPRKGIRFVGPVCEQQAPAGAAGTEIQAEGTRPALMLPDKPSIAVLPFSNFSDRGESDYFGDGIADDIITELSRFSELFVIARNSSFRYRDKSVDVQQIGRELGVRYVLQGNIRREGNRARISVQLMDATNGGQRWAERYDRSLEDIFAIQDDVVRTIAPVLAAHINRAEIARALLKPPSTWHAHDYFLRGTAILANYLSTYETAELHEARRLLEHSLSADPNYARAYSGLSYTYFTAWLNPVDGDFLKPEALDQAHDLARKAVGIDSNLPVARAQLGMVLTFKRRHDEAVAEFERAQSLNPNFNDWRFANSLAYAGEPLRAIEKARALIRLDPFYPPLAAGFLGFAHYMLRQYEPAIAALGEAANRSPRHRPVRQWLAAAYAQVGQLENAREEAAAVLQIQPNYTISAMGKHFSPLKRPEDAEHLFDGLRKAGLPDS
jgi:adenylate cyclase